MGDQYTWVWVAVVFALVWFMLGLLLHILAERRTQQERRSKIRTDDLFLSCSIVLLAKAVFTLALTVGHGHGSRRLDCQDDAHARGPSSSTTMATRQRTSTGAFSIRNGADKGLMCEKPLRTQ
jgi:hypothetical protein